MHRPLLNNNLETLYYERAPGKINLPFMALSLLALSPHA